MVDTENFKHVPSIIIFFLMVCERNGQLWKVSQQFLKYSFYWFPGIIQSCSSLEQVKQFILTSGSIPDQGIIHPSYFLYFITQSEPYNLFNGPFISYDHFTMTTIFGDIAPYGAWLLIVAVMRPKDFVV